MTAIKTAFAVSIKLSEIIDQVLGNRNELVPGEFVKIVLLNEQNPNHVIKVYNPETQKFGKSLYQCGQENVKRISDDLWNRVKDLRIGTKVILRLALPCGNMNVMFMIMFYGDCPSLGVGRFFGLNLIDSIQLTEEVKMQIQMKYYETKQSMNMMRVDKLIDALVLDNFDATSIALTNKPPLFAKSPTVSNREPRGAEMPDLNTTFLVATAQTQPKVVTENLLIDFESDVPQKKQPPLQQFYMPTINTNTSQRPHTTPYNMPKVNSICQNSENAQLQNLKEGLDVIKELTAPDGRNQYGYQMHAMEQNLYERNSKMQEYVSGRSSQNLPNDKTMRYSTPPSDQYYNDANNGRSINMATALDSNIMSSKQQRELGYVKDFRNSNNAYANPNNMAETTTDQLFRSGVENRAFDSNIMSSSSNKVPSTILRKMENINHRDGASQFKTDVPMKQFQLPQVFDMTTRAADTSDYSPQFNASVAMAQFQLPQVHDSTTRAANISPTFGGNFAQQPPEKPSKKPRSRKNRQKNNTGNKANAINCYICHKTSANKIKFDCQHIFCGHCLVDLIDKTFDNVHCPFENGNYKCSYKLMEQDLQRVINIMQNNLTAPKTVPKSMPHVARNDSQKVIEPKNTNVLVLEDDDDDSNEVLFRCKQENCKGLWFVDKSEGRNTYQCPVCETYNCFKCQIIHDNMTCEEYNRHARRNSNTNLQSAYRRDSYEDNGAAAAIRDIPNELEFAAWTCIYCDYGENNMDTAICIYCSRTNDHIRNTQQSSSAEYYRLLELEENDTFIPNFDEFECIICAEIIEPEDGVQLRGCLHNFCRNCIIRYIEGQQQAEIPCPFDGCNNILEDREIKTLVSQQAYERHLEISLRVGKTKIQNGYQCCVPNCPGYWIFTDQNYKYNCPVPTCRTENCISCKASHPGIDCKTYQQNLFYSTDKNGIETRQRLEQMLQTGEAEHCPKCNIIVVKNGGCPQMVCSMCRQAFRWGEKANRNLNIK